MQNRIWRLILSQEHPEWMVQHLLTCTTRMKSYRAFRVTSRPNTYIRCWALYTSNAPNRCSCKSSCPNSTRSFPEIHMNWFESRLHRLNRRWSDALFLQKREVWQISARWCAITRSTVHYAPGSTTNTWSIHPGMDISASISHDLKTMFYCAMMQIDFGDLLWCKSEQENIILEITIILSIIWSSVKGLSKNKASRL